MRSPRTRFAVAVLLQLLVLVGMAGIWAYTLTTGTRVLLKTEPIDPRDPFRGDYVRLRYEISALNLDELGVPEAVEFRAEEPVWVLLSPGDPYWRAAAVSASRPAAEAGQVAVRARVEWYENWEDRRFLHLRYGIESFFVPEGEGRKLEGPEVRLDVEAAVDRFGRAVPARIFHDGREVRFQ